jgi:hypothetical protein
MKAASLLNRDNSDHCLIVHQRSNYLPSAVNNADLRVQGRRSDFDTADEGLFSRHRDADDIPERSLPQRAK